MNYKHPFENMGLVFRHELKNKNWTKIEKLLPTKVLTTQDTKVLYKWAIKDKKISVIEHLNQTPAASLLAESVLADIFTQAFNTNDTAIVDIICRQPKFDIQTIQFLDCPYGVAHLLKNKRTDTLIALIENGANPHWLAEMSNSLFGIACKIKDFKLVNIFLEKGIDPNYQGIDYQGHIIPSLLHNAMYADYQNAFRSTFSSANYGLGESFPQIQIDILKALFAHKANPNLLDKEGNNALMCYVGITRILGLEHMSEMFHLFLNNGLAIEHKNHKGQTLEDKLKEHFTSQPNVQVYQYIYKKLLSILTIFRETNFLNQSLGVSQAHEDFEKPRIAKTHKI